MINGSVRVNESKNSLLYWQYNEDAAPKGNNMLHPGMGRRADSTDGNISNDLKVAVMQLYWCQRPLIAKEKEEDEEEEVVG